MLGVVAATCDHWVTGQAFPITDGTSFSLVPSWLHSPRMILLELVRNDPPLWAGTSVVEQVLGLSLQAFKSIPSNKGEAHIKILLRP